MPVPLAMMIPFMFMQSIMMGYGFGTGFQYSKRKISAMSNTEFNATNIAMESSKMFKMYQAIIPSLETSIEKSHDLQQTIIEEMVKIPAETLARLFGVSTNSSQTTESPAAVPVDPRSPDFPKSAADVFKETPPKVLTPLQQKRKNLQTLIDSMKKNLKNLEIGLTKARINFNAFPSSANDLQVRKMITFVNSLKRDIKTQEGILFGMR